MCESGRSPRHLPHKTTREKRGKGKPASPFPPFSWSGPHFAVFFHPQKLKLVITIKLEGVEAWKFFSGRREDKNTNYFRGAK